MSGTELAWSTVIAILAFILLNMLRPYVSKPSDLSKTDHQTIPSLRVPPRRRCRLR